MSAAIGAAAMLAASGEMALANRQPDGASDTNYIALGQWFLTNALGPTASVLNVDQTNGVHHASGVVWDKFHVITAAHVKNDVGRTNMILTVSLGTNALSNDCQVANVIDVKMHPSWDLSHEGASLDVAVLTVDRPLIGQNAVVGPTPVVNDIYTGSGFAPVSSASGGELPYDANIRGWTARMTRFGDTLGYFSTNYIRQNFGGSNAGPQPGGMWYGDSGGGQYNSANQLMTMNVAFSVSGIGGATYSLRMDVAGPWVDAVIATEAPMILSCAPEGNDYRISWRASPGVSYVVQASSSLTDTNLFADISAPITNPASGSEILEYLDPGAVTSFPARFYRIRKIQN